MDVRFDSRAAQELIEYMSSYCSGIVKETRELLDVTDNTKDWNDRQKQSFQNNITALAKDLNSALSLESEYMKTYQQRVNELRG